MTRKMLEDETRRAKRQSSLHQPSIHQPSIHTNSLPRPREHTDEFTYAVYNFCDDEMPYRTKIPGTRVTLNLFKEYLPKKGNFR